LVRAVEVPLTLPQPASIGLLDCIVQSNYNTLVKTGT
jgi:hypothetical protein